MGKKKEEQVIDAETVEVNEEAVKQEVPRCEVRVGMDQEGQLFFTLLGSDQNLITVDGLLDYAKREMDKVWKQKLERQE